MIDCRKCQYDPICHAPQKHMTGCENYKEADPDVVRVVRCKDCKYWQDNNGGYPHDDCRWGKDETPDVDDFCSYGERRADND